MKTLADYLNEFQSQKLCDLETYICEYIGYKYYKSGSKL
jgi:hypothetical protein